MRAIHVFENVSLDGVMQAPSGPEEGYPHGGWFRPYADTTTAKPGTQDKGPRELLLGRRTYGEMERGWRHGPADNPFTAIMNSTGKHVVSRTLTGPLDWENSHLVRGEAAEAVAALKQTEGPDLTVLGSASLAQALIRAGLVDGVSLLITPLLLGIGKRLFEPGLPYAEFELVSSEAAATGVIVATYRRT